MLVRAFDPSAGTGVQQQLGRLLPPLIDRGITPTILSGRDRGSARRETWSGAAIHRSLFPGYSRISSRHFARFASNHIRRWRREYDLMHVHGILQTAQGAREAILQGLPVVIKVTRAGPANDLLRLLRSDPRLAQFLLEQAWFIAQTSLVREEIVRAGVDQQRIFSIPNGVDPTRFRADRSKEERLQIKSRLGVGDEPTAVYVGRLEPVKRLDLVIRALSRVPELRLLVVGDGSQRGALEGLAGGVGVEERVHFVGKTPDVRPYLEAADVFVLPTSSEGFANSMLEAMATAVPCVVSPILGVDEVLGDGDPAVLIAEDRPEDWARALAAMVRDTGLRESVGGAGLRRVRSRFTLDATADKIVAAYGMILGRG